MNIEQLQAFVGVAREGRLTVAARRLGVSQSGLTRQLQALEGELGVRLLVRTPGGAVLTDAGERFLPHARRALEAVALGRAELGELTTTPRGPVTLGTLQTVGTYLLPELIRAFKQRYPEVIPRLSEGLHDVLEARVAGGSWNCASWRCRCGGWTWWRRSCGRSASCWPCPGATGSRGWGGRWS